MPIGMPSTPSLLKNTSSQLKHDRSRVISSIVSETLGEGVAVDVPLMEAGFSSLMATRVVSKLEDEFATSMPATLLFDHPTIDSLAQLFVVSQDPPRNILNQIHYQQTAASNVLHAV